MPKAHKFTNGQNFTVLTSHDVSGILNSKVKSDNGSIFKGAVTQGLSPPAEGSHADHKEQIHATLLSDD